MNFFRIISTIAIAVSLTACGGGGGSSDKSTHAVSNAPSSSTTSSNSSSAPSVTIGTTGVFDVDYGQFSGVYTFLENGDFYGLHFVSGTTLAGHPHGALSATNSTTAPDAIAWANFIDDAGMVGKQEAAGEFGRTFSATNLNVSIKGSMGNFTATASSQKLWSSGSTKTLYKDAIPMDTIAGTYKGILRTVGIDTPQQDVTNFVIDTNGAFTVVSVGCTFTGNLVQHGVTGIFDTNVQTSGTDCHLNTALKGITTPLSFSNNLPQLAVQLNSTDASQTAVFVVTKTVTLTGGIFDETSSDGFHNYTTILEDGEYFAQENISPNIWHGLIHGHYTGTDAAFTNPAEIIYDGYLAGGTGARQDGGYGHGSYINSSLNRTQNVSASEVYNFVGTQKTYSASDSKTLYDNPIPLANIAGTYSGVLTSVQVKIAGTFPNSVTGYNFGGLKIEADGKFSVDFSGCTYSGTLVPHGAKGVFDLTTILSSTCDSAGTMTGIVTPLGFSSSTNATTLLFQMLDANEKKSVYMMVTKP